MAITESIKRAMERGIKAVTLRPSTGIGKDTTFIETTENGLAQITDGDTSITIDLSKEFGGGGKTPSAGQYVRAALGACLAQGYLVWAAQLGVAIGKVSIEIQSDYDMRGNLGIDPEIRGGITALHYVVNIESSESPEKIQIVVDQVAATDYVLSIFAEELNMTREINISPLSS